jgi:hypothetical protein
MTVSGVDYTKMSDINKQDFTDKIGEAFLQDLNSSGVTLGDLSTTLTPGSVLVNTTITAGSNGLDVDTLQTVITESTEALQTSIIDKVKLIPGLDQFQIGSISIIGFTAMKKYAYAQMKKMQAVAKANAAMIVSPVIALVLVVAASIVFVYVANHYRWFADDDEEMLLPLHARLSRRMSRVSTRMGHTASGRMQNIRAAGTNMLRSYTVGRSESAMARMRTRSRAAAQAEATSNPTVLSTTKALFNGIFGRNSADDHDDSSSSEDMQDHGTLRSTMEDMDTSRTSANSMDDVNTSRTSANSMDDVNTCRTSVETDTTQGSRADVSSRSAG